MDQTIRSLTEQVKTLAVQVNARIPTPRTETAAVDYHRQGPASTNSTASSFMPYSQPQLQPQSQVPAQAQQGGWVNPGITQSIQAPLGPPPQSIPTVVSPPIQAPPAPVRVEDWDSTFLTTLGQNDHKQLRDLLSRSPPDVVLPVSQPSPLSQTVILALIHRMAISLTELSPADDAFKTTLWWLQRSALSLNPKDNVIAPYISRVLQTAQSTLNTTVQRLNVLPGGPSPAETSSMVGQIQQTLSSLMT